MSPAERRLISVEALRIVDAQLDDDDGHALVDQLAARLSVGDILRARPGALLVEHALAVSALIARASDDPEPRIDGTLAHGTDLPGDELTILVRSCRGAAHGGSDIDDEIAGLLGAPVAIVGVDDVQPAYRDPFEEAYAASVPLTRWLADAEARRTDRSG